MSPESVLTFGRQGLELLLAGVALDVELGTQRARLAAELPAKVDHYGPQLKLYTLALARIYQRPVTECHLHFLTANKTVRVEPPTATKPV